jgi:hypothetical protein
LILEGNRILTTPDSGCEENIISKKTISTLGLTIENVPQHQKEFRMGNNLVVKALGRVAITCRFAREQALQLDCWFYVFNTLITPAIMGMAFLDATETLTKNKHRLQPCTSPMKGPLQCSALNNPKRRLKCFALTPKHPSSEWAHYSSRKFSVLVNADTGSEVNLISSAYYKRHPLKIQKVGLRDSKIVFADGTIEHLLGKVNIDVTIGGPHGNRIYRTFYVVKDLTCDMLFGNSLLDEINAFDTYRNSFILQKDDGLAQVNTIIWLNTLEKFLLGQGRNKTAAPEPLSSKSSTRSSYLLS